MHSGLSHTDSFWFVTDAFLALKDAFLEGNSSHSMLLMTLHFPFTGGQLTSCGLVGTLLMNP